MIKLLIGALACCVLASISACVKMPPTEWANSPPDHARIINAPKMKIGDSWTYKFISYGRESNRENEKYEVIQVNKDGSYVVAYYPNGTVQTKRYLYNSEHLRHKTINLKNNKERPSESRKEVTFPLWVGKKWEAKYFGQSVDGSTYAYHNKYTVLGFEEVTVEAGKFDSVHIHYTHTLEENAHYIREHWYSPQVKAIVLAENMDWHRELIKFVPGN